MRRRNTQEGHNREAEAPTHPPALAERFSKSVLNELPVHPLTASPSQFLSDRFLIFLLYRTNRTCPAN